MPLGSILLGKKETADPPLFDTERSLKLILIGDTGVGKTSLALRFVLDEFRPYSESTIGASFFEKVLLLEEERRQITFKIWDTAGQEKYRALAPMYYRGADAAVVVFDISKASSFQILQDWVDELKAKGPPDIQIVVCGNKLDLEMSGDRQVLQDDARIYSSSIGAAYIETSARDNSFVQSLFETVARLVPDKIPAEVIENTVESTISLGTTESTADGRRCCGS